MTRAQAGHITKRLKQEIAHSRRLLDEARWLETRERHRGQIRGLRLALRLLAKAS